MQQQGSFPIESPALVVLNIGVRPQTRPLIICFSSEAVVLVQLYKRQHIGWVRKPVNT